MLSQGEYTGTLCVMVQLKAFYLKVQLKETLVYLMVQPEALYSMQECHQRHSTLCKGAARGSLLYVRVQAEILYFMYGCNQRHSTLYKSADRDTLLYAQVQPETLHFM